MITLEVHSSLEAVGFIARIATELTRHGMGVNPVAGSYHDHLIVPDGREAGVLGILAQIARERAQPWRRETRFGFSALAPAVPLIRQRRP